MKKWMICIWVALLLCGCGRDALAQDLHRQLEQLPAMGELARMDAREQIQVRDRVLRLYDQYQQLTPMERLGIPEARERFDSLFAWFQTGEAVIPPLPETVPETTAETVPETTAETVPETTEETVPETTTREVVVKLTEEDQDRLLRLAMAERGEEECPHCLALIMRTVLNRVESGFGSSVRKVIYAQDQFGPAMDGSLEEAKPNDACREALDLVIHGWDESGGALFYEWVEGETWHSRSLKLTAEHCDGQFYKR